jgi:hypothetical protein
MVLQVLWVFPLPSSISQTTQITEFLAKTAVPNLRRLLMDNDKVVAACSNIVYYVITPSMKGKNRLVSRVFVMRPSFDTV